jgi:TonB-linked SusC/RagA family outer membrane protein
MRAHIFLLICFLTAFLNGYSQKLSFKVDKIQLEEVFKIIKNQTGHGFFYEQSLLNDAKLVTVNIKDLTLTETLDIIFKNQPLKYIIKNVTIIVSKKDVVSNVSYSLPRLINGKIVTKTGEVLPGANISIIGKKPIVLSDSNGRYSIIAEEKDSLSFKYLGFINHSVKVGSNIIIDVVLEKKTLKLNDVVVVGYGQVGLNEVTGAMSSINSLQIGSRAAINVFDALQGQVPGVEVSQQDGRAAAQSSVIIRGIGTFGSGAAPLYIVDGSQNVNIDGINPLDIEKIEILKDAASAAIYGSRGANGVIFITTKKGKEEIINIDGILLSTWGCIAHKIPIANATERRLFDVKISGSSGALPTDSLTPGRNVDNNAYDFVTRIARRNDANFAVSGGSKIIKYYSSFGYTKDESVIVNQWAKLGRFRLNSEFIPSPKLSISNNFQFSLRDENLINERNVLHHALARNPYYVYYYPDGSFAPTLSGRRNPLANALLQKNLAKTYDANLYSKLQYKFIRNLMLTVDVSLAFNNFNSFNFMPRILNSCSSCTNPNNSAVESSGLKTSSITQVYFNYQSKKSISQFSSTFGASIENRHYKTSKISASDFISEEVTTLNSAQVVGLTDANESENGSISIFSRVGYNFKNKLIFSGVLRADASSRFGKNNRWGHFPSISAAYVVSEEPSLSWTNKFLSNFKVRTSYGIVGNDQSLGDYDAVQQYVFVNQYYNGVSGVSLSHMYGNNLLSWETNKQFNIGLDLSFFKNRLKFTVDYYKKTATDLLYLAPLPQESGFANTSVNLGTISNKGLEFLVSFSPYVQKNWNWTVSYNIAHNKGIVKELANHTPIESGAGSLTQEGQPLGNFFGWKQLRIFPYDESNAFDVNMNPLTPNFNGSVFTGYTLNNQPYTGVIKQKQTNGAIAVGGDVDWEDVDKNGIIDDADRSILGNAQPDFTFGFSNNLTYKKFSLIFNIYGSIGGKIYNAALADQTRYTDTGDTPPPAWIYGSWYKPGDITDMPKAKTGSTIGNTRAISSRYIEDASFIRLRNIRIEYVVAHRLTKKLGAKRISIFTQSNNLMTYSNYQHFDPEISKNNPLQLGVDGESGTPRIPRKNEFIIGLNATF